MDQESLLREKERQIYEQLRARPRPKHDSAILTAVFSKGQETWEQGAHNFVVLMNEIKNQNAYLEEWRVVRNPEDYDNARGIYPLKEQEVYFDYLSRRSTDDGFHFEILAFSRKIRPDDLITYSAQMNYSG